VAELALVVIGFCIGLAAGRWFALLAAVAAGVWVGLVTEVDEVPAWFLGLEYGVVGAAGIAAGVLVRRSLR
jgi:hypothetical protein